MKKTINTPLPEAKSEEIENASLGKSGYHHGDLRAGLVEATRRLIAYVAPLLRTRESAQAIFADDPRAGEAFFGSYGATKSAQIALAKSFATESASIGPKVHIITPAPMPTATRARFFPGEDRDTLAPTQETAKSLLADLGLI